MSLLIMLLAFGCGVAMAMEYKVGDNNGWTIEAPINCSQWASDKTFFIGDILRNGSYAWSIFILSIFFFFQALLLKNIAVQALINQGLCRFWVPAEQGRCDGSEWGRLPTMQQRKANWHLPERLWQDPVEKSRLLFLHHHCFQPLQWWTKVEH